MKQIHLGFKATKKNLPEVWRIFGQNLTSLKGFLLARGSIRRHKDMTKQSEQSDRETDPLESQLWLNCEL